MLAIHAKTGAFATGWLAYCQEKNVPYKVVDCFSSDIIEQLRGCRALLWHWQHNDHKAALSARQLIASAEEMGLIVFPNTRTSWHYDDKIGQKYLLEAIGAPLIPSHVFYSQDSALEWIEDATFPVVWKLRGGAGSQNVRLVRTRREARRIVKRSFGQGWSDSRWYGLQDRLWQFRRDRTLQSFVNISRGVARALIPHEKSRNRPAERNYVYFQDFIPGNFFDIRAVVIGDRCYAFRRMVREGDFRASGSGLMDHDPDNIPQDCVVKAFETARRLDTQSAAFDFVVSDDACLLVEVSYAFGLKGYRNCPGYWDSSLRWHEGPVSPERFMMEDLLIRLQQEKASHG